MRLFAAPVFERWLTALQRILEEQSRFEEEEEASWPRQ